MSDILLYLIPIGAFIGIAWALFDEIKTINRKIEAQERFIETLEKRVVNYIYDNNRDMIGLEERIEELENENN